MVQIHSGVCVLGAGQWETNWVTRSELGGGLVENCTNLCTTPRKSAWAGVEQSGLVWGAWQKLLFSFGPSTWDSCIAVLRVEQ